MSIFSLLISCIVESLNGDTFTVENIIENGEVTFFTSNSELKLVGKLIFNDLEVCYKYLEKSILK